MFLKGGNSLKNDGGLEAEIDGEYWNGKLELRYHIFNIVIRGRHLYVAVYVIQSLSIH